MELLNIKRPYTAARLFFSIICFIMLAVSNLYSQHRENVSVDFKKPEYFALVKNKASIFLEDLPQYESIRKKTFYKGDSLTIADLMEPLGDLKIGIFRSLISQGRFKNPGNYDYRTLDQFIKECYGKNIIPALTLFQSPSDFRKADNANLPPGDLDGYGNAMKTFTGHFKSSMPVIWEVWNEPELKGFLDSDQPSVDYNRIYETLSPKIKESNEHFLVAGPVAAGVEGKVEGFCNSFIKNVEEKKLPLDIFTIHAYGRYSQSYNSESRKSSDHTEYIVDVARNALKENHQTVPILFTEYEYYPAGVKHAELHANRELTNGAVKFLSDLKFFIEQSDIAGVTWNRYINRGENYMKGGLVDLYLNKRPIFYAFQYYGRMPAQRNKIFIAEESSVSGLASSNEERASVLLWNDSEKEKEIKLSIKNIPENIRRSGYVKIFRVDKNHSSYLENSLESNYPVEVRKVNSYDEDLLLRLPGPGIIYIEMDINVKTESRKTSLPEDQFIRSWQWCGREIVDGKTIATGDYGNFDWMTWTSSIGVKNEQGLGLSGVSVMNASEKLLCTFQSYNVKNFAELKNRLIGIRLDYKEGDEFTKSVLLHGELYDTDRDTKLPWGAKTSITDQVIYKNEIGTGKEFILNINKYAPEKWKDSNRELIISFWLEDSGEHSQGFIQLKKTQQE